ncbi:MAG: S8 family serine peptidase [Acidobacteriota bacterium]|nr:S8 family serine peptidase [Acidobacteriota bacterium]
MRLFRATAALLLLSTSLFARQPDSAEIASAAARTSDGNVVVLVELADEPIALYEGGLAGFPATARAKTGFDLRSARREEVAKYRTLLEQKQEAVVETLRARVPDAEVGARYQTVLNGFALVLPAESLGDLARVPGVAKVHAVKEYHPTIDASNAVMGTPAFWSALGGDDQAGAGIRIGILDTGVDFSNPMFSDLSLLPPAGFPRGNVALANGKVIVARFFQSSADARDSDANLGHRTAQDLVGHGSHSAAVAGGARVDLSGSGRRAITVSGVAPKAWIGSYRIFAPRAFDDNIIAAIESAVDDGMDVINMSFGGSGAGNPLNDPIIRATENAIAAGVIATISAGNSGPDAETIGYPGAAPSAITVGATANAHYGLSTLGIFEVLSGSPFVPSSLASVVGGACADRCSLPISPVMAPLIDVDVVDGQLSGIACTQLPGGSLNGRIALVQRGTCTFAVKGQNVQTAGGVGMVIYNSDDPAVSNSGENLLNPSINQASVPAVLIRRSDGLALKTFLAGNPGTSAVGQLRAAPPGTPPFVAPTTPQRLASFSSRGPTPDFQIKPDLATVGTDSYAPCQDDSAAGENRFPAPDPRRGASVMFDASGFLFANGTSFSAPRAAGAAALVKQKHPGWTPEQVKAALTETAARPIDSGKIGAERLMSRGSGDIDLAAAATVESLVLPTSASFGRVALETTPFTLTKTLTLSNLSAATVTYALAVQATAGDPAVVPAVTPASVTLAPGESRSVTLRLSIGNGIASARTDSEGFLAVSDGRMTIPEILYVPYWIRTSTPPSDPLVRAIDGRIK